MYLSVRRFLNISVRLAFEAANIIEQVYRMSVMNKVMKGKDDPVTEADYRIQKMISTTLRELWPTLTIVGEEELSAQIPFHQFANHTISEDIFPKECLGNENEELELEHVCAWIDPVDATRSYTQGQLNEVTTLIGLSFKNRARLGVIGLPYLNERPFQYYPRVMFGSSTHPKVYQMNLANNITTYTKRKIPTQFTITTSRVESEKNCKLLSKVGNKVIKSSGLGKKIHQVITGDADAMVFFGNRCSRWDTCAGQALISAIGGRTTGLAGEPILYDPKSHHYSNNNSVISTLCEESRIRISELTRMYAPY